MIKKRSIKMLGLVLAVLMSVSLLAGCAEVQEVPEAGSDAAEGAEFDTLSMDVFSQHKLTMVNCFATWCSPCVREIPDLDQLRKDFADKDVNVIGVVLDTKIPASADDTEGIFDPNAAAQAAEIAEKAGIEYSFYIPDLSLFDGRFIGINAVPHTFFVNSSGEIVGETYEGSRSLSGWTEIVEAELAALG